LERNAGDAASGRKPQMSRLPQRDALMRPGTGILPRVEAQQSRLSEFGESGLVDRLIADERAIAAAE
jgi:hypothetical protein